MKVTFDEKRAGYFIGDDRDLFQIFAYFTCDPVNAPGETFLEFDVEKFDGREINSHFQISIGKARFPSCDLVETLVAKELCSYLKQTYANKS